MDAGHDLHDDSMAACEHRCVKPSMDVMRFKLIGLDAYFSLIE